MLELLYLSVLDDSEQFEFVSLDTLAHPLDFLESIEELRSDHRASAMEQELNATEVFGFFGPADEVAIFEDDILEMAYGFRMHADSCYEPIGIDGAYIQSACIDILQNRAMKPMTAFHRYHEEETAFSLFLLTAGESFPWQAHCRIAIEQYADAWLQQEKPLLLKRQVMTIGSALGSVRGKRIIVPHFDSVNHRWELLLEGARRIGLRDDTMYQNEQSDSSVLGRWTEPDIDVILLDPAYGFGLLFYPKGAIEDWLKSLLYCCALSFYLQAWSYQEAREVYLGLLEELKCRLPYEKVPPIVEEEQFVLVFLENARRRADALRGIEESALTSRFASEMSSRTYQLSVVARIVLERIPQSCPIPARGKAFSLEYFRELLVCCDARTNDQKGLALEELAAYLLSSLDGWVLAGRRVRTDDCEIDLCYVNASLCQRDWDMGSLLLVECKNRASASSVSVLRNLSFIMDAKGARSGIIISMAGFTQVVREQVIRLATQGKTIILISGSDLQQIADGLLLEDCIRQKIYDIQECIADDFALLC